MSSITVVEPTIDEQRYAPHSVRMAALKRDGFKCRYCGALVTNETANMDHVIPWKKGGKSVTRNLVTACRGCNRVKGNSHWVPNPLKRAARPKQPTRKLVKRSLTPVPENMEDEYEIVTRDLTTKKRLQQRTVDIYICKECRIRIPKAKDLERHWKRYHRTREPR